MTVVHTTDAWVLYQGTSPKPEPTELVREDFTFEDITAEEVLVRPLFGCWEGNMGHALNRLPVDIAKQRGEDKVVLGNAGVVEILEIGADVKTVKKGDKAILFCNGEWDKYGYPKKIFGYDAKGTIGLLARTTKLHQYQVIPIPDCDDDQLARWAAFSLRYITAWSNWRLAYGMLRLQLTEEELPVPTVWGWGGGVSLAELHLAVLHNCRAFQVTSREDRMKHAERLGITAIDRKQFSDLNWDDKRYKTDAEYKAAYRASENAFLKIVEELSEGNGANIFIDYVGSPVIRATLKALARQGVLTTAGWKEGMQMWFLRAIECIDRHQHVHTHYARYEEGLEAVKFAIEHDWLPTVDSRIYAYDEIPELAADYEAGNFTYYPVYSIQK